MKNPDYFNKETADKLHDKLKPIADENNTTPLNIVKQVNKFYWGQGVRKAMENETSVFIKHLGTIVSSRRKIIKEIRKLLFKIRKLKYNTWLTEKRKGLQLEQAYKDLKRLLKKRNELAKLYYEQHLRISETIASSTKKSTESNIGMD